MSKEPTEIVKALIGFALTLLAASIVGLTVFVIDNSSKNATQDTQIEHLEKSQEKVIDVVEKNTQVLQDLRVLIEGLKKP